MTLSIKMASIHVTDPAAAHAFYTGVLGLETLMAMPEYNLFIVKAPGQTTGLLLEPSDNPIAAAYMTGIYGEGHAAITLGTDDLDAEIARLADAGVAFRGEKVADPSGSWILVEDTVGNLVQLHQGA